MPVGNVSANGGGTVSLVADGGIVPALGTGNGVIRGGIVTLTATKAGLGTSTSAPLLLDVGYNFSGSVGLGDLTASANGAAYLKQTTGDLWLNQLTTNGNSAWIWVAGSLYDANTTAVRDDRTADQLRSGVWGSLSLTGTTGAAAKQTAVVASYVTEKEGEYRQFWQYKALLTVSGEVPLTAAEIDYYTQLFTTGACATAADVATCVANDLQTLVDSRTTQYNVLNQQWTAYFGGTLPSSYDPTFVYVPTPSEQAALIASVPVYTEDQMLHLVGAGLLKPVTDTNTVIEDPNITASDVTLIVGGAVGLTSTPTVIDLGTGHPTNDELDTLAAAERTDISFLSGTRITTTVSFDGSAGTITKASGDWSGSGLVHGSTLQIEGTTANANDGASYYTVDTVVGNTITLIATDSLKSEAGKVITIDPIAVDPGFQASGTTTATVTFQYNGFTGATRNADTITRTDGGSFVTDGITSGSLIEISGPTLNATGVGAFYTVTGVTASMLTLSTVNNLATSLVPATVTILNGTAPHVTGILVQHRDDLNVDATGKIDISAGGNVFIGSEQAFNFNIHQLSAGGDVRIKGALAITNASNGAGTLCGGDTVVNICAGGNVILEAAGGGIGTIAKPFDVSITGTLTARANDDVVINAHTTSGNAPDMKIESVYSQDGIIKLTSDHNMVDALDTDFTKLQANRIELYAGGDIGSVGSDTNYLDIHVAGTDTVDTITAVAGGSIWISETSGDLRVRDIAALGGDASLRASGSILDIVDVANPLDPTQGTDSPTGETQPGANVVGDSVTLIAQLGSIGALGNDFDIITHHHAAGTLTASSNFDNAFIIETPGSGDLYLNTVSATGDGNETVFITNPTGAIYNGAGLGAENVTSGLLWLFASGDIGQATNAIATSVGKINGKSSGGSVWIENTAPSRSAACPTTRTTRRRTASSPTARRPSARTARSRSRRTSSPAATSSSTRPMTRSRPPTTTSRSSRAFTSSPPAARSSSTPATRSSC